MVMLRHMRARRWNQRLGIAVIMLGTGVGGGFAGYEHGEISIIIVGAAFAFAGLLMVVDTIANY